MTGSALERARLGFLNQQFMTHLGAQLTRVEYGAFEVELPVRGILAQQDGFVHAGAIASVLDTACGFAALTTVPAERTILTAEFKINLLRPAVGNTIHARARVIREGRSLVVCQAVAVTFDDEAEFECAVMTATLASVPAMLGNQGEPPGSRGGS
jgi:uncharacterized protein (TIGR00369 family)